MVRPNSVLKRVKTRIGVFYSEANKDAEIQQMINAAISYFKGAGWDFSPLLLTLNDKEKDLAGLQAELSILEEIKAPSGEESEWMEELKDEIEAKVETILEIEAELSLPIEALVLYCKMAQPTSAFQLTNHPVLTSMIAQGRSEKNAGI